MDYEINVARLRKASFDSNGGLYFHYFRAQASYGNLKEVYKDLCEKYPSPKYKVDVYRVEHTSQLINVDDVIKG